MRQSKVGKLLKATAILLTGLILVGSNPVASMAEGEGTSGAAFLKIGTSARAEAMGGAFTAAVDDVDATYWNPAGLMQLQRSTIGLTHLEWFQDIRYEYISYADKYDYIGAIGISLGYLYLGDIPKTLETSTGDYDVTNSGGTFGASDMLLNFGWAGNLGLREHIVGVAVKIIQESIDENASFSVGLDLGNQFLFHKTRWYRKLVDESWAAYLIPGIAGISVKNLGTPVKFFNQNDPLPLSLSAGLAYKLVDENLTVAADFNYYTVESLLGINLGAEYWINSIIKGAGDYTLDFALRAGFRTGYDSTSAPGFSFGGGMRYGGIGLDYVYMPFGDLGNTHRVSLKVAWGELLKDKVATKRKKIVKKKLSVSEREMRKTAAKLRRQKRKMEGKTVFKKSEKAKRSLTKVEAKKPKDQEVAKETKSLGADIKVSNSKTRQVAIGKGAIIKGRRTKVDKDLIAKITSSKKSGSARSRTRSKYMRRTKDDVVRAARQEAEQQSQAFDEVESAAKKEAVTRDTKKEKMVTKTTVYFAKNSRKLNNRYLFALDKIAMSFDRHPQRTILVHGHASGDESDKKNLSLKRAKAVKQYLVQIKSIPSNKVAIKALADKKPAKKEKVAKDRARNRRVRIQIIKAGN